MVKPTLAMLIENIDGNWRKTGDARLLEGSSGTNSFKPETYWIYLDHGVQGSPGGG
jgi:hypothetical protein